MDNHKENNMNKKSRKENKEYIFRPWITTKNGKKIYAKSYGLKAFKINIS